MGECDIYSRIFTIVHDSRQRSSVLGGMKTRVDIQALKMSVKYKIFNQ